MSLPVFCHRIYKIRRLERMFWKTPFYLKYPCGVDIPSVKDLWPGLLGVPWRSSWEWVWKLLASENSLPPSQSTQRLIAVESEGLAILAQCRPTLKGHSSSRAPGGAWSSCLPWQLLDSLTSSSVHSCFLPFYRSWSEGHSLINILLTKLHLKICFLGNTVCNAVLVWCAVATSPDSTNLVKRWWQPGRLWCTV